MRHEFSRKTKRAAWERCGDRCEALRDYTTGHGMPARARCNAPLRAGHYVFDHIDPDWFSGCNDLDNCQVICDFCNKLKTADDAGNIAKSKRIRDRAIGALTTKRKLPGGKSDWRKKKLDGTIVDRRTGKPL